MKQLTGIMTDHCQADATVTYSLISAVRENIQHQRNSSSVISIFLEHTSRFIPIQWHSKLSILDTDQQICFSTFFHHSGLANGLLRSVQGNQIEIHTLVEKPKLLNFQTVQYLFGQKKRGRFCTSTSKKLKCITQRSPRRRRVKLSAFLRYTSG